MDEKFKYEGIRIMKKILSVIILMMLTINVSYSQDKYSQDYLQNHKHFAIMNPLTESIAEHIIKSSLQKETGGKYKVKFDGYTTSSMKKGIFKNLEITGENIVSEDIPIPYVHLKSISNYNYVDYTKDPIEFKSDMKFSYDMQLSAESINKALQDKDYKKILDKVNNIAYPLFQITSVSTKIQNNQLYILTGYNFPIAPIKKDRVFVASSAFTVKDGKIRAGNIKLDSAYGNLSLSKVANLLNLVNPLEFTLALLNTENCRANVENVNIVDNKVKIDGKIFVKGD